jgi:xanthine dehydrogenase YagS FAD-binding subunit
MRPFTYTRQETTPDAVKAFAADAQFLAGGTTLVDLMRLNVMRPQSIIDINPLSGTALGKIEMGADGLKLGALAHLFS